MISTTSYKSRLSHKTGLWACRRRHSIASRTLATARPRRPTASPSRTPTPSTMQRGPLHRRRPQARLLAVVQRLAHSGRWHLYHIRIAPVMYSISMRAAGQAAERGRVMPRGHEQHTRVQHTQRERQAARRTCRAAARWCTTFRPRWLRSCPWRPASRCGWALH